MAREEKDAENRDSESDVYIAEYKDAIAYGIKGENYGCLDFIDDLIVDVTVIHDNFSKTLKKRYKVIQNETSSGAQNLCHCEIISDPKCLGMSEIALPSILETDNSTTEDVEEKVRMKETLDDLNLSLLALNNRGNISFYNKEDLYDGSTSLVDSIKVTHNKALTALNEPNEQIKFCTKHQKKIVREIDGKYGVYSEWILL